MSYWSKKLTLISFHKEFFGHELILPAVCIFLGKFQGFETFCNDITKCKM